MDISVANCWNDDAVLANYEEDVVEKLPSEFECGIYCGWASVGNGPVYKMVMSVGFNPFYNNTKKTMVCNKLTIASSPCFVTGDFKILEHELERSTKKWTNPAVV